MTLRSGGIAVGLSLPLLACAANLPVLEEVNEVVLRLREYRAWAWLLAILAIWADFVLPVPQPAVIAGLGLLYGAPAGGLLGSVGLVSGGFLGYALARRFGRGLALRLVGARALARMEDLLGRSGVWAIVLTRSLPYSIPEAVVVAAGLGRMPSGRILLALALGSVPTAFVFAAIGAGWDEEPALALAVSYALPILLLPLALHLLRGRKPDVTEPPP
jgi:uncharacterized membrane protein YdjX (TVP38/TMEM64 family)